MSGYDISRKSVYFVIEIIIVSFMLVYAFGFFGYSRVDYEGINKMYKEIEVYRVLGCFAYEDGRVYLGVIDVDKFNEEWLRKCGLDVNLRLSYGNKEITIGSVGRGGFVKYVLVEDDGVREGFLEIV